MDDTQRLAEASDNKTFSITINGRPRAAQRENLPFNELVDLAFDSSQKGAQIVFTITFRNAAGRFSEGELDERQTLKVQDGTVVNVTRTDQS